MSVALCWSMTGCAGGETNAVLAVGARNLRCQRSEVESALQRESAKVSEYYVGCDFMYTRVLCDRARKAAGSPACYPAKPQPPCFSGGCFEENPETFEWELTAAVATTDAETRAETELLFGPR